MTDGDGQSRKIQQALASSATRLRSSREASRTAAQTLAAARERLEASRRITGRPPDASPGEPERS